MTALENAIQEISAQQAKLNEYSPAFQLGEQLKDIISESPDVAGIVLEDLKQPSMKLTDCEKNIAAFAKNHRHGNAGCCPPKEADRIIREFYGIPARQAAAAPLQFATPKQQPKKLSLADFL